MASGVVALWGYSLVSAVGKLRVQLGRIEYWSRLAYVTLHIRNEKDDLTPAIERVQTDLAEERTNKRWLRAMSGGSSTSLLVYGGGLLVFLVFFLIALSLILHYRIFGEMGADFLSSTLNLMKGS